MVEQKRKTAKASRNVKLYKKHGSDAPSKEELAVAKYVRFKCPTKSASLSRVGEQADYFVGSKAVDCLMESKWSAAKNAKRPLFTDRRTCVDYLQRLMLKGLFLRVKKLLPKIKERTEKTEAKKSDSGNEKSKAKSKKTDDDDNEKVNAKEEKKERKVDKDDEKDKDVKEKRSRKAKLEFHDEQIFIDSGAIYVWKYDPTSMKMLAIGLAIVIGAIVLCLFPLWPPQVRVGVYYLSIGAMGLVGVFLATIVLRTVVFGAVWLGSLGRHHLWIMPNLTEDCGVMDSLRPLYSYKYVPPGEKPQKTSSRKKRDSDDIDDDDEERNRNDQENEIDDLLPVDNDSDSNSDDELGQNAEKDESHDLDVKENTDEDDADEDQDQEEASSDPGCVDDDDEDDDVDVDDDDDEDDQDQEASSDPGSVGDEHQQEQTVKKRRKVRRDDQQDNGDFEFL